MTRLIFRSNSSVELMVMDMLLTAVEAPWPMLSILTITVVSEPRYYGVGKGGPENRRIRGGLGAVVSTMMLRNTQNVMHTWSRSS